MQKYALGFLIWDGRVLLINKNRPTRQAGKQNGIGGHVEVGETPIEAMVRETQEETGLQTSQADWSLFAVMLGDGWAVECFMAESDVLWNARSLTDEILLGIYYVNSLPDTVMYNLRYMIPLALDKEVTQPVIFDYRTTTLS